MRHKGHAHTDPEIAALRYLKGIAENVFLARRCRKTGSFENICGGNRKEDCSRAIGPMGMPKEVSVLQAL